MKRIFKCSIILFCIYSPYWGMAQDSSQKALDEALEGLDQEKPLVLSKDPGLLSKQVGTSNLWMDFSLNALMAVGGSTVDDESLQSLEGGAHDPKKNGFTLQQVELGFQGAIDPYLRGEAYITFSIDPLDGETTVELEEAFLTTQSLPFGLQIEAGQMLTDFGLKNPTHPHSWFWQDQPFILTRLFGGDGQRGVGARIGWLIPIPWFADFSLGIQNANGETMPSFLANQEVFEERAIGGLPFTDRGVNGIEDFVYLVRLVQSWIFLKNFTTQIGASGLYGPNATGSNSATWIWGVDFLLKWKPERSFRGWPFVIFEGEFMQRIYDIDDFFLPVDPLLDYGFYTQILYGFYLRWAAGLRGEFGTGNGESVTFRENDPYRDDRFRISPLIAWYLSEFSRLRLQYNYDNADHLPSGDAHSVWFGIEFTLGKHAAHKF